jgi:hypothetical protein
MLSQLEADGKRWKWIIKIKKYDLVIKPTRLIQGQGIEKLMVEVNLQEIGINVVQVEEIGDR